VLVTSLPRSIAKSRLPPPLAIPTGTWRAGRRSCRQRPPTQTQEWPPPPVARALPQPKHP